MAVKSQQFKPTVMKTRMQVPKSGSVDIAYIDRKGVKPLFEGEKLRDALKRHLFNFVNFVFSVTGIPDDLKEEFAQSVVDLVASFQHKAKVMALPSAPPREYEPGEGIVNYITSDEGLGRWLEAGVLTRPLIKQLSPAAYQALANFLRKPENRAEYEKLGIPNKSQVVDRELQENEDVMRQAARLESARRYRTYHAGDRTP